MTAVELQEQSHEARGDLRDRVHGVRLEVEKVRREMAKLETRLSDRINGVGGEVEKVRTEMAGLETRLSDRISGVGGEVEKVRTEMAGLETRLSDRMGKEIGGLRSEMVDLHKSLRGWLALGASLMMVLVALVAVLG